MIPATGGPVVMGMEKRPSREPMAWLAPWDPHRSKAIGPIRVTKQPSKRPMTAQMRSSTSYLCSPASWAVTIIMDDIARFLIVTDGFPSVFANAPPDSFDIIEGFAILGK